MKILISKVGIFTADEDSMYNLMNILKKGEQEDREWLAELIYNVLYAKGYFEREAHGIDLQ